MSIYYNEGNVISKTTATFLRPVSPFVLSLSMLISKICFRNKTANIKLKNFQFTNWSKGLIVTHLKLQKSFGSLILLLVGHHTLGDSPEV